MLNKAFRNNGFVVSVGNGMGTSLFPCPAANILLRQQTDASGVNWSGCDNYGYSDTSVATYNYFTDGNCGEYSNLAGTWNRPIGDILYSTDCCQVIWDGSTYYVEDNCNPCGAADTATGETRVSNINEIYWEGCGESGYFSVSYEIESEYHVGDCSTYWLVTEFFYAENGTEIYSKDGCCFVTYDIYDPSSYYVIDDCGAACPEEGPTGNTSLSDVQELFWSGCGTEGYYTYAYNSESEYHDGVCGTYWSYDGTWSATSGETILDNGCCTVNYQEYASYTVNDNCENP
jgi:hypothetical protein